MRIERRLRRPRWLLVAVPACSLVFAFFASGIVLLATGHDALSSYRLIFDAAFLNSGALGQTLIAATPLAFTGLARIDALLAQAAHQPLHDHAVERRHEAKHVEPKMPKATALMLCMLA